MYLSQGQSAFVQVKANLELELKNVTMNCEEASGLLEDLRLSTKQQLHIVSTVEANQEIIRGTESTHPHPPTKKASLGL